MFSSSTMLALLAMVAMAAADGTSWRSLPATRKAEYTFAHFEQEFQRTWGECVSH